MIKVTISLCVNVSSSNNQVVMIVMMTLMTTRKTYFCGRFVRKFMIP